MATAKKKAKGFTAAERAAMRERVRESKGAGEGESAVLAKLATMKEPDRAMGRRIHAIVRESAPDLTPRLWYGMPAYARDGKVVCFFKGAHKFKSRYAELGFTDNATLDDGNLWPTVFGLTKLTAADEARISALVKRAVA